MQMKTEENYSLKKKKEIPLLFFFFLLNFLFFFQFSFFIAMPTYAETPIEVRVIYDSTKIYSSTFDFSQEEFEESSEIKIAELHEVFEIDTSLNPDNENFYYVKITNENGIYIESGYILKTACIDNSLSSPQKQLSTNAKIIASANIYTFDGENYVQIPELKLDEGIRVKIISGWDKNKEYTQITYQIEDGPLITNYVKTSTLNPDGIDYSIVLAITFIVIGVSITLILIKIIKPRITKKKI